MPLTNSDEPALRVLIADDHPIVRAGIRALLTTEPDIETVGEATSPGDAVSLTQQLSPDLVLMDLQFSDGLRGTEAIQKIRALAASPHILVLTNYDTDADILSAIEAGASGYILKDAAPETLIAAIRAAASGQSALAPAIAGRLMAQMRDPHTRLSDRERAVLELVDVGASNGEIAARLHISEATVKSHLVHVFAKLGVSTRSAAVTTARSRGDLRP